MSENNNNNNNNNNENKPFRVANRIEEKKDAEKDVNRIEETIQIEFANRIEENVKITNLDRLLALAEYVEEKILLNLTHQCLVDKGLIIANKVLNTAYTKGNTMATFAYSEGNAMVKSAYKNSWEFFIVFIYVLNIGVDKMKYVPAIGNTTPLLKHITNIPGYIELCSLLNDTIEYIETQRDILKIYTELIELVGNKLSDIQKINNKDETIQKLYEFFSKTLNFRLYSKIVSKINIIVTLANNQVYSSFDTRWSFRIGKTIYKNIKNLVKSEDYIHQIYRYLTELHNDLITQNTQLMWILTICSTLVPGWDEILKKLMEMEYFIDFMNNYVTKKGLAAKNDELIPKRIGDDDEHVDIHKGYSEGNNKPFPLINAIKSYFSKTTAQAAGKTRKRIKKNQKKKKKRHSKTKKYKSINK